MNILIVEDEAKLARLLADYLLADGYDVSILYQGNEVVEWLKRNEADLVLLDVMLPGLDGISVCREIRTFSDIPIIMVTARVEEIDRLVGLETGADDYICKPFSPREVVARVKALLRRVGGKVVQQRAWELDDSRYEFKYDDVRVQLSAVEFHLMARLCRDPGRIYSRQQLMTGMYADNRIVSERTIDSHVKKLRGKLAKAIPGTSFVESVYGVGYRFDFE